MGLLPRASRQWRVVPELDPLNPMPWVKNRHILCRPALAGRMTVGLAFEE
jgi:hypothetical protein